MILGAVAFVAGAWGLQQQEGLPHLTGALALVPLAGLAWLSRRRAESAPAGAVAARSHTMRAVAAIVAVLCWATAGYFWAAASAGWKLVQSLDPAWEGRDVEVRGVISELVQPFDRGMRLQLDVEQAHAVGVRIPSRITLAWYRPDGVTPLPELRAGQRWRLTVRLRQPHGTVNPGGFDYEAWLLERGVRATGYVVGEPVPQLLGTAAHPKYWVRRLRESIRDKLREALAQRPHAGTIIALAIGDQRAIPPAHWQVFTRTGVNHLMSISGLHITMVAGLAFLLVLRLWRRVPALVSRLPALRAAAVSGLASAAGYAALAGFAVPAQRTVCMLAVVAWALWLGWTVRPVAVLALAAAVAVAVDPMAVISPGFWLSFGAVAVIMLAGAGRIGRAHWLHAWLRAQWAVTLALVPLLLALFQQVSLVSPLANAFAIPVVSLVVVPLALLGVVMPGSWPAVAAHAVMSACMVVLEWLSVLPAAVWQQHAPLAWTIPLAVAGALWMLLPRGFPARWVGALLLLPMFLVKPGTPGMGEFRATVLDVGQGLAVVVRTHGHALLFDAGPAFGGELNAGDRIVVPYLRAEGIAHLDGMIVSHDDLDHSGGAMSVLAAVPVDWVSSSLSPAHALHAAGVPSQRCSDGQAWNWDGVRFEILHPGPESYNFAQLKDNERSCVLLVSSAHGRLLLPGDIERDSEQALVQRHAANLAAGILVVPHHGSRTSSTPRFIAAVAPQLAVVTAGYRNRFGHPHPVVVATLRRQGARILRTDQGGAIIMDVGAAGIQVREWRREQGRYWRSRPD